MRYLTVILMTLLWIPFKSEALLDNITLSGNPAPLTISTATAGSQPDSASDSSTTYGITTSLAGNSITGHLSANMPTGLTLSVELEAPFTATSLGSVALSTTPADLVTNLPLISLLSSGHQITYTLDATVAASPAGAQNVTVTFTIQ